MFEGREEYIYAGLIEEIETGSINVPQTLRLYPIPTVEKLLGEEYLRELFRTLYEDELLSIREIAELTRKSPWTIRQTLHKYGIAIRPAKRPMILGKLVDDRAKEGVKTESINGERVTVHYIYPFPEMAYIIGFAIGDGSFTNFSVFLWNTEFGFFNEILERATKVANYLGESSGYAYYTKTMMKIPFIEHAYAWRIKISSSALARAILTPEGKIREQAINLLLKPPFKYDFLAGLWDADGTSRKEDTKITLIQTERNKHLIYKIIQALNSQGIATSPHPYIYTMRKSTRIYNRPITAPAIGYELRIYYEGVQKWKEKIGRRMLHPKKWRN
ncbi:MAG: LAGLIDADG family homing endonuclease [Nitrososphaeria archaeon]